MYRRGEPAATTASTGYSKEWCERMVRLEAEFDGNIEAGATAASASQQSIAERAEKAAILGSENQCRDLLLEIAKQGASQEAQAAHAGAAEDAVVEANRQLLLDRSRIGIAKYGVTLAAAGLSRSQLAQHALEEALDLANYLQTIIQLDRAPIATSEEQEKK
jgi:hypothetical protein